MVRTLCALAILVTAAPAAAQGLGAPWTTDGLDDYWITRWERPGVPSTGLVVALAQDREGFLWLGTSEGLVRFDGFDFQPWSDLSRSPLAGTRVRTLFIDRSGALWVGFDEGTISRISGREAANFAAPGGRANASVRAFTQDADGTIWAGTTDGLYRLVGDDRWGPFPGGQGLPPGPIVSALHDSTGSFFVGTPHAVFRRRAGSVSFEKISDHPTEAGPRQSLCTDAQGHLVTTDPARGFRVVENSSAHTSTAAAGEGLKITCGRDGTIWVGTLLTGLWRVSTVGRTHGTASLRTGLLGQAALAVLEDRDQNLWVSTGGGVYRLTPRNVRTLPDSGIPTTLVSDRSGRMWAGTPDGLLQFTRGDDGWRRTGAYLTGMQIRTLHVDPADAVWVATADGVMRVSGGQAPQPVPWGGELRRVRSMTSDSRGTIWVYDDGQGLFRVDGGRLEPLELAADLRGGQVSVLHADRRNRLWLVGDGGVEVRSDDGDIRRYTAADGLGAGAQYRSIHEDESGAIWLGSTAGLSRVVEGRIDTIALGPLVGAAWVKTIVEDRRGQLWLGIDRGGVRISRAGFQDALRTPQRVMTEGFELFDGLPGSIRAISDRVAARAASGQLWFTTDEGIGLVDPDATLPSLGLVPARIAAVRVDDRVLDPGVATVGGGHSNVAFSWAALDLTTADRVRFRYRLDGFDQGWTDAGTRRQIEYARLPPGSYVFRVAAAREGNSWSDTGTAWSFTVAPQLHQRAWFPVAVACAIALGAWGLWYMRMTQVRRRFAIALHERARVSREVHDTLLQSLVGVALQCQALAIGVESPALREKLVRLRRRVDEHIEEARELIWNLRSPTLERYDLVTALRRSADDAIDGTRVAVEFNTHGTVRSCLPRVERELLRIGQEAISNAVRHGRPTSVRVDLRFEDDRVRLSIVDDGAGFNPTETLAVADRHCGLLMMSERAAEVGGTVSITSQPAHGTRVEAQVPLGASAA